MSSHMIEFYLGAMLVIVCGIVGSVAFKVSPAILFFEVPVGVVFGLAGWIVEEKANE